MNPSLIIFRAAQASFTLTRRASAAHAGHAGHIHTLTLMTMHPASLPAIPQWPALLPQTLLTLRVRLRLWQPTDWPAFAALNADAGVMQHFPAPLTRTQSDAMADKVQMLIARQGWGFWAAEHRGTRQFMGFVGLGLPSAPLPFQPCVEIGWRLARPWWGQGLASEAARAALAFAWDTLQLPEVVAFTATANTRSEAVMQRLGMRRDATTFEHPALPPGHPLRAHWLYRLQRPAHTNR